MKEQEREQRHVLRPLYYLLSSLFLLLLLFLSLSVRYLLMTSVRDSVWAPESCSKQDSCLLTQFPRQPSVMKCLHWLYANSVRVLGLVAVTEILESVPIPRV